MGGDHVEKGCDDMSDEPSREYSIRMGFTAQDQLRECMGFLRDEYLRIVDRACREDGQPFESKDEVRDALYGLARKYATFVGSLTDIMSTSAHDGDLVHIRTEGKYGFSFYRPGSGYHGAMIYTDGGWSIHT
jgi:hypothetical protein